MLPALAPLADLEARLGLDPDTLTGAEKARAQAVMDDVSTLVRYESRKDWLDLSGAVNAPVVLLRITLGAALRCYRNPDGETIQTTGPFSRTIKDAEVSSYLTDAEKQIVRRYRPVNNQLWTQPTTRSEYGDDTLWLEDQYGFELFPIGFANEPWR